MIKKYSTRRQFLNYGKLSLILFLNSCSPPSKKIRISLQSSFYPQSLKDTFPASWQQETLDLSELRLEKNKKKSSNSDFILINDGWINKINFESYQNIRNLFPNDKLNNRSKNFLNSFKEFQRDKLFPIGVVPYAVIIKNNKDFINDARKSWDFLLAEKLKGKIIFPESPRIIMSIAKKINANNSLGKLKGQAMLFDDRNSINWLINSNASVAIIPYSLCLKYLKLDSRLSIVCPDIGVPLMWNFLLSKTMIDNQILIDWINSFEKRATIDELANEGWYLPFNNQYAQNKYKNDIKNNIFGPSKICWKNSWSLFPLNSAEKLYLENFWKQSLTP